MRLQAILHGCWGVVPASQHQEILVALAPLIRAKRYDAAVEVIAEELGRQICIRGINVIMTAKILLKS